ncbi:MAG: hypothetical protein E3J72_22440 [Planctomycetota bacterium]|nr:MAG: hypothetical protein E3J72_22440 [Planctomycetota bacterium]
MSATFTVDFRDDGSLLVRMAGKLRGHAAREGLMFLKNALEAGQRKVRLDLRQITSIDSIGRTVFNWIRGQNGSIDVLQPVMDFESDELAAISLSEFSENETGNSYHNTCREEIA